jgi:hypothetical protein
MRVSKQSSTGGSFMLASYFPLPCDRFTDELAGRRHIADYTEQFISAQIAGQCLRRAVEMDTIIERILGEP